MLFERMAWRRALYVIPAGVSAATAVLAILCLFSGARELDRVFPGFFVHANGTLASMQRGGWEGSAAGLRPGDVMVSADGQPMRDGAALRAWLRERRPGEVAVFTVSRRGRAAPISAEVRLRRLTTADTLATFILPCSIGTIYLLLGGLVFFLKRSYEAALAMSICVVAAVFYLTIFDAHTAYNFARLWVGYPLLGAVSVHLFSVFPAVRPRVHRVAVLAVPYSIAAGLLACTETVLHQARYGTLSSSLSSAYLALCFVADILLLTATAAREPSEAIQNKAKTIRVGLLVTAAAGVVWSLVARIYPELITAERAIMLSGLFPILLAYAVIKKNLFDVDFFLRTTSSYVIASAVVLALYFAAVFVIGQAISAWTQRYVGFMQSAEAAVVSTMAAAMLFHPLRLRVQRVVDRFFFRSKGELESAFNRLGKDLASMTLSVPTLAERLTAEALRRMRCGFAALLVQTRGQPVLSVQAAAGSMPPRLEGINLPLDSPIGQYLSELNEPTVPPADPAVAPALQELWGSGEVSMVLPLRTGNALAGVLLLGARHHGDVYTGFEMGALRALTLPAALALENALLLQEHAERERLAALGRLSTIIIHEIKNPLGIIRVSSGTLKKRFDSSDSGYELASFIEEEVVRMNQTIGQFLTFARPSNPRPVRFELCDLIRRTAAAAQPEMEESQIQLMTELPPDSMVLADPDQVQQVLLNLLVNARQALEGREGASVRLIVGRARPSGSPAMMELQVSDNGPGIPPSVIGRVFEPFFTTRHGGTGLGLAIARQLIEEQGGRISVRSGPWGTEFTILLPAARSGAPST